MYELFYDWSEEWKQDHMVEKIFNKSTHRIIKKKIFGNKIQEIVGSANEELNLTEYQIIGEFVLDNVGDYVKINCSNTGVNKITINNMDANIRLKEFRCFGNCLSELDCLENTNVCRIFCGSNKIAKLDKLPDTLEYLDCAFNPIVELNNLPNGLIYLNCENCEINNLTNLPTNLEILICANNKNIISLEYLPDSLIKLNCGDCGIEKLDDLPSGIMELTCYGNKLTKLLNLPKKINLIKCEEKVKIFNNNYKNLEIVYF
jgi:hypothetical protein